MQQHLKPLLFCVLHILHLRATQPPNPENLNLVQARAYVISLRSLLKKQPLVLQRDDGLHKIGGKEQCSQECLRKILARMRNWVQLVKEVIRAELPFFEVFTTSRLCLSWKTTQSIWVKLLPQWAVFWNISCDLVAFNGSC